MAEQKDTLAELRRLAEAATPGRWLEDDGNVFSEDVSNANYRARSSARRNGTSPPPRDSWDGLVAKCGQELPNFDKDAEFIAAASPATVLKLLDVVEAAKELYADVYDIAATERLRVALAVLEGDEGRGGR